MMYIVFLLSVIFVASFVGFSCKPSPIYGGLGLIVGGGVGCGMVMSLGGSFLGLMVFLVYLGGMLVVFGYTTAMATEEYPEAWGSNVVVLGGLLMGLLVEGLVVILFLSGDGVGFVSCGFKCMEDWVIFSGGGEGFVREDCVGVSALYNYGVWFMAMAGWALLVSVLVVVEVTRGG
ncbi:NADH dehydrogenase subunit 6 (mitochondrion) [Choloepus didactylus]|uniref:NADH-ubiquinone oxidoreductase chain 6 n=1 Tax=Choloepus didactylus TaxID=27675 RepID=Q58F70_CHODI|nr:NADH dehydrogenase subunit 6 [Choloepus didactylus]AAX50176.1 NADH dehydrogenase subunit 6 [Choloepus didactylus]ALF62868.1 NADH dehydrogenase subunit 6 [Choloepus didactylus]ALO62376.1 NADH dehydrogenase subunit 6 [Choloepus didactylus]